VVGLEPSCTAVFRSDAPGLFPDDQDVLRLRDRPPGAGRRTAPGPAAKSAAVLGAATATALATAAAALLSRRLTRRTRA
jgi:hypothetical protein